MSITSKELNQFVVSGRSVTIFDDAGNRLRVSFYARDRAYGEFRDESGKDYKLHRDDIILAPLTTT